MNTNEINQKLHALLELERHELILDHGRGWKCCCGDCYYNASEVHFHLKLNHDFTSDAGRVELLRIFKDKKPEEWIPVLQKFWNEKHIVNGSGSIIIWKDYPEQLEGRKAFNEWIENNPNERPSTTSK